MHQRISAGAARLAAVERWLAETDGRLEALEAAILARQTQAPRPDAMTGLVVGQSINDWCREAGFGKSTFYVLARAGQGPKIVKVRGRTLITETAAAYFERREREAEESADAPAAS
jgi:hypothetical protein